MMSKERELLQKVVNHMWQGELVDEIKELLAQPEEDHITSYYEDLRTAPPKREPLSDAQIAELWGDKHSGKTHMVKNFARAIEKAHGIGGGK